MDDKKQPEFLVKFAKQNRKNLSLPEVLLWKRLRSAGQSEFKFRKQVPLLGKYIVDFYVPELRLIVEVDGENYHDMIADLDEIREESLTEAGYKVLRIGASRVLEDPHLVVEMILERCRELRDQNSFP